MSTTPVLVHSQISANNQLFETWALWSRRNAPIKGVERVYLRYIDASNCLYMESIDGGSFKQVGLGVFS